MHPGRTERIRMLKVPEKHVNYDTPTVSYRFEGYESLQSSKDLQVPFYPACKFFKVEAI